MSCSPLVRYGQQVHCTVFDVLARPVLVEISRVIRRCTPFPLSSPIDEIPEEANCPPDV